MLNVNNELIIDNFAGGGGASTGIELATGRSVDVAINHDPDAIAMHKANHPNTIHYCEDVFDINPLEVTKGRPVALCWLSPDCKHFSKAKGGKPVDKKIRGLAWIAVRWAAKVKPRMIILENVEEFKSWGPLKDNRPDPEKKGQTFNIFVKQLQKEGYEVEWRELKACDYGAPTTRKRFFMIARCDGQPIVWPEKTHGARDDAQVIVGNLKPYRNASEIIDWSIPGNSIFERKKPLCDSTMKRIARGIFKFVINNPDPFIVRIGQTGFGKNKMQYPLEKPLTTITTKAEHCLVTPTIMVNTTNHNGSSLNDPLKTITTGGHHALVAPTLIQMGYGDSEGKRVLDTHKPLGTITSGGNKFATATAFISKYYGGFYSGAGIDMRDPTDTITQSDHHSLVVAFLTKYYGSEVGQDLNTPLHTITTKDRFGLVTIKGEDYKIVDITLRMLQPRELFLAQGFPGNYIIDKDQNGEKISKAKQIARCGNSVSPPIPKALVRANLPEICKGGSFAEQVELLKESVG
ncbi:DNA cytosine methyltransferase [Carnobacterium maltaromaticum]|uniref:DNA cytosine methyltransferase n=1 Tax=Carnobacterium maltaromaticum TaxID=2751 RepID=UPI0012FBD58B|nr:DNA cytosine methyltransferase [Carnobacterium maltaromaticum]